MSNTSAEVILRLYLALVRQCLIMYLVVLVPLLQDWHSLVSAEKHDKTYLRVGKSSVQG